MELITSKQSPASCNIGADFNLVISPSGMLRLAGPIGIISAATTALPSSR